MIQPDQITSLENIILIVIAIAGSIFANFIRFMINQRLPVELRPTTDYFIYFCYFVLFPIIGGFLALIYILEGTSLTPFLALHIGITAPLTLSALAGINGLDNDERID